MVAKNMVNKIIAIDKQKLSDRLCAETLILSDLIMDALKNGGILKGAGAGKFLDTLLEICESDLEMMRISGANPKMEDRIEESSGLLKISRQLCEK